MKKFKVVPLSKEYAAQIRSQLVGDDDVVELIPAIFEQHANIEYLHARNAQACCYICKIERAEE